MLKLSHNEGIFRLVSLQILNFCFFFGKKRNNKENAKTKFGFICFFVLKKHCKHRFKDQNNVFCVFKNCNRKQFKKI